METQSPLFIFSCTLDFQYVSELATSLKSLHARETFDISSGSSLLKMNPCNLLENDLVERSFGYCTKDFGGQRQHYQFGHLDWFNKISDNDLLKKVNDVEWIALN